MSAGLGGPIEKGRPLRFGIVGLGYWGPNLLRVLSELPDVEVTVSDLRTDPWDLAVVQ